MTVSEKLAALDEEQAKRRAAAQVTKPVLPVDAASLLLLDRSSGKDLRVLMGKRHSRHTFMPDLYVFPGGRRERDDNKTSAANPLSQPVIDKLLAYTAPAFREGSARGLAIAAARETEEETGLSMTPARFTGQFRPDLSPFRLVARAITPPGQSRRFDTRFFACFTDEVGIDPHKARDSDELTGVTWVPVNNTRDFPLPRITRVVLDDLLIAIDDHGELRFDSPVPFYRSRRGSFTRDIL